MDRFEISRATFVAALAPRPTTRPPAAELTHDNARLLDAAGFRESSTATWAAAAETATRIRRLVCAALTANDVAQGLGITATRVQQKRLAQELWGITDGQSWVFPAPQFEPSDDGHPLRVIRGMADVLKALPEDLHPITVEGFLSTPQVDLSSDRPVTPLEWLRCGGDVATLLTVAYAAYRY